MLATLALLPALLAAPQGPATFDVPEPDGAGARRLAQHVSGSVRATQVQSGSASFYVHIFPLSLGTGFPEAVVLHAPTQPPVTPAPLVVVFHQFGTGHLDVLQNTEFVQAAFERGWYLVCPLGASKKHLSSLPSQLNTTGVLNWVVGQPAFNIDTDRIYGVGFSMGGGAALNYAARHKDPSGLRFAAIVNHTGNVSNINSYADDCVYFQCTSQFVYDFWFGNGFPGTAAPWNMAQASLLDYDALTLTVTPDRDFARNLIDDTPVRVVRGDMDMGVPYLIEQTDVFDQHMRDLGAIPGGGLYEFEILPYATHDWGLLDEGAVLDWLGQFTLTTPNSAETLVDRDARFYHFDVALETAGVFGNFDWQVSPGSNSVSLRKTRNVAQITVDTAAAGLSTVTPLFVAVGTADGLGDDVRLTGFPNPPTLVQRDGITTPAFVHDPLLQTVTLSEATGGLHVWLVTP